jgi:hypothetical protein
MGTSFVNASITGTNPFNITRLGAVKVYSPKMILTCPKLFGNFKYNEELSINTSTPHLNAFKHKETLSKEIEIKCEIGSFIVIGLDA